MKKQIKFLLSNPEHLTIDDWQKLFKHCIDGLAGTSWTEKEIEETVPDFMQKWIQTKYELLNLKLK